MQATLRILGKLGFNCTRCINLYSPTFVNNPVFGSKLKKKKPVQQRHQQVSTARSGGWTTRLQVSQHFCISRTLKYSFQRNELCPPKHEARLLSVLEVSRLEATPRGDVGLGRARALVGSRWTSSPGAGVINYLHGQWVLEDARGMKYQTGWSSFCLPGVSILIASTTLIPLLIQHKHQGIRLPTQV